MSLEPLFKIKLRLRKMTLAEQCAYLIACIACEKPNSPRRGELNKMLVYARSGQISKEMGKRRPRPRIKGGDHD